MRKILQGTIIAILFFGVAPVHGAFAQTFRLELTDPSAQITVGSSFDVNILINTASQETINGDALINFESAKVSISSALSGNFYTYFSASPLGSSTSQYLVSSWEESIAHAKSTAENTLFATVTMSAVSAGTTTLSFACTPGTEADSNINKSSDSSDIINCSGLNTLSLTIASGGGTNPTPTTGGGGGGSASPTPTVGSGTPAPTTPPGSPTATRAPTATRTPTRTRTPTPAELPRAGLEEVTILGVGVGAILTVVGTLLIL